MVVNNVPIYIISDTCLVGIIHYVLLNIVLHIIIPNLCLPKHMGVNCCDFGIFFLASYHVLNYNVGHV
jgi:hypothetical protein